MLSPTNAYMLGSRKRLGERTPIARVRYQLLFVWIFAAALPFAARFVAEPTIIGNSSTFYGTALAAIGSTLTLVLWRRLHALPGGHAMSAAVWSTLLVFTALAAFVLFFRIDYSRTLFFAAPAATLICLITLSLAINSGAGVRVGVVSGGRIDDLPHDTAIEWAWLRSPDDGADCDAFVADLRHDHAPEWDRKFVEWTLYGVPLYHVKQVKEHLTGRTTIDHLSENEIGSILPNLSYMSGKRILDLGAVLVMAIPLGLVCLAIAIAIRVTDGAPVIFRQERIGFRGRPFTMLKFRTMTDRVIDTSNDALKDDAKTKEGDPRITRLGNFLRKYRLDELPQIVNIARGEMSWIGPRPEARALGEHYEKSISFYHYRYAVRPGITGWAQVTQGHVTDDDSVRKKLEYDFYYVKNVSFWLDMTTAIKTLRVIFGGIGAK
ncbi:MAG: sugar transferase [Pseudomonadota bacterium]